MKVGLFFSRSDGTTDQAVDLEALAAHFNSEHKTSIVNSFFKTEGLKQVLAEIEENSFDAVVLAGDSPVRYLKEKCADHIISQIEACGVNLNQIGFANIREHVALVHRHDRQKATEKARVLVQVAIEKVKTARPIKTYEIAPHPAVAVIGATPGGILAAQRLLERDLKVYIIDEASQVRSLKSAENQEKITSAITYVEMHPRVSFLFNSRISDFYGYPGRYILKVDSAGQTSALTVGSIVIANTGDLEATEQLRPLIHIDVNDEGLFEPVNPDTMKVFTHEPGIFLLLDDQNQYFSSLIASSDSVAFAVVSFLEKKEIHHKIMVSDINEELCSGCCACIKTCMFKASRLNPLKKISEIDDQRCKGCGNCVTSCPTGARDLLTYPQKYLTRAVELMADFGQPEEPKILAFLCEGCGYTAVDLAGINGLNYPEGIMPLGIRCGGNIDTQLILEAYKQGFHGVIICKCPDINCRNIVGNSDLDRRANLFREILRSRGINSDTLRIVEGLKGEKNHCIESFIELHREITGDGGDR